MAGAEGIQAVSNTVPARFTGQAERPISLTGESMSTENPSNGVTLKPVVDTWETLYGTAKPEEPAQEPQSPESAAQKQPQGESVAGAEQEAETETESTADPEGEEDESSIDKAKKHTAKGVQKRLDELTRRAHEAEERFERAMAIIEKQASKAGQQDNDDFTPVQDEQNGPPRREQYRSDAEYLDALVDHRITERDARKAQEAAKAKVDAAEEVARAKYEDYDSALGAFLRSKLQSNPIIADAIFDSDVGAEVAYKIGSDQGLMAELKKLPAYRVAAKIAAIEDDLKARPAAEAKAPPAKPLPKPPASIQGGSPVIDDLASYSAKVDLTEAEQRAYIEARRRQAEKSGRARPY